MASSPRCGPASPSPVLLRPPGLLVPVPRSPAGWWGARGSSGRRSGLFWALWALLRPSRVHILHEGLKPSTGSDPRLLRTCSLPLPDLGSQSLCPPRALQAGLQGTCKVSAKMTVQPWRGPSLLATLVTPSPTAVADPPWQLQGPEDRVHEHLEEPRWQRRLPGPPFAPFKKPGCGRSHHPGQAQPHSCWPWGLQRGQGLPSFSSLNPPSGRVWAQGQEGSVRREALLSPPAQPPSRLGGGAQDPHHLSPEKQERRRVPPVSTRRG